MTGTRQDYAYRWCGSQRDHRYGELVDIVERGPLGTVHVRFLDGTEQVAHATALRRERHARPVGRPVPIAMAAVVPSADAVASACVIESAEEHQTPVAPATDVRRVPTFAEVAGQCSWCAKSIEGPRGAWHQACWLERERLIDKAGLFAAVVERDGLCCGMCGRAGWVPPRPRAAHTTGRLELEHRVPLWAVAHLPILARRLFFTPSNLWLVCVSDHARKTSAEATLRAELRRCL